MSLLANGTQDDLAPDPPTLALLRELQEAVAPVVTGKAKPGWMGGWFDAINELRETYERQLREERC